MIAPSDEIRPLYRAIQLVGLLAVLVFVAGLIEFLAFEPPGQSSGTVARVTGVFPYDPASGGVAGAPRLSFGRNEEFAAVVDWASIPPATVVAARWFDAFGEVVGQAGPGPAGSLPEVVPVTPTRDLRSNLPGTYLFVVERINRGVPVEVLARLLVQVERS